MTRKICRSKQLRGDCFPALVSMLTPIAVVVLAVILELHMEYTAECQILSEE